MCRNLAMSSSSLNLRRESQIGRWIIRSSNPVIRRELNLVRVALEERLESQARMMLMFDHSLHRQREPVMGEMEKSAAMEAEVSGL
jgi:hypothetical protein